MTEHKFDTPIIDSLYTIGFKKVDSIKKIPEYMEFNKQIVTDELLERHNAQVHRVASELRSKETQDKMRIEFTNLIRRTIDLSGCDTEFKSFVEVIFNINKSTIKELKDKVDVNVSFVNIIPHYIEHSVLKTVITYNINFILFGKTIGMKLFSDDNHCKVVMTELHPNPTAFIDTYDWHNCVLNESQLKEAEQIRSGLYGVPAHSLGFAYLKDYNGCQIPSTVAVVIKLYSLIGYGDNSSAVLYKMLSN